MRRQLRLRAERLERGERPIGWKLGFGAPTAMRKLSLKRPLVGFLTDAGLLDSGATCAVAGWTKPMLEPEIAAHLARDVPPGADRDTVLAALAGLGPAIELADLDPPPDDVEAILAGNIFHRHVLLGPVDAARRTSDGVVARVVKNGEEVARTDDTEALTGELAEALAHVATLLAEHGEALRAGDVVITGSAVPPMEVAPGDAVTVEMAPLGSLAVTLA